MIGRKIKYLLEEKGIKQKELAEKIGVHEVTVSRYINGNHTPPAEIIKKIAEALGVTSDYLLSDDWKIAEIDPMDNYFIVDTPSIYTSDVDDLEATLIPALRRAWSKLPPDQLERKLRLAKKAIKIAEMLENEEM